MPFLSSLNFFVFWYCHSCALLCNSNKVLVIPEIFRWYYRNISESFDTFSHNCSCCAYYILLQLTSHIYVRDLSIYTKRASSIPSHTLISKSLYSIQTTCACFESYKSMNMFTYLLVLCLSWEQLLKNYNLYQIHFRFVLNLKEYAKHFLHMKWCFFV